MPNPLDTLTAPAPPKVTPEEINQRLAKARAAHYELNQQHAALALDAEAGIEGAAGKYLDASAKLTALAEDIARLESALLAAKEQRQKWQFAEAAKTRTGKIKAVEKLVGKRNRASDGVGAGLYAAVQAWKELLATNQEIAQLLPVMAQELGQTALIDTRPLGREVANEIARLGRYPGHSDSDGPDPRSFPGGQAHVAVELGIKGEPERQFGTTVKAAGARLLNTLAATRDLQ
jgi:hypothetical protein